VKKGLACLLLLIIALPTLLSTNTVKHKVLKKINHDIPGHIEISHITLSWLGPQIITGFQLFDYERELILSFDSLQIQTPPPTLLLNTSDNATLNNFQATLDRDSLIISLGSDHTTPPLRLHNVNATLENETIHLEGLSDDLPFTQDLQLNDPLQFNTKQLVSLLSSIE